MEIQELRAIVKDMAIQHAYPGFEVRSLRLGLPAKAVKSQSRLFRLALEDTDPLVKLAALRWFQERPSDARKHIEAIAGALGDEDEWVRLEAVRAIELTGALSLPIAEKIAGCLIDSSFEVQKAAAKACGKIQNKPESILNQLRQAASSPNTEVRWKAQKALRKLGVYSQPDS